MTNRFDFELSEQQRIPTVTTYQGRTAPAWWDAPGWEIQRGSDAYLGIQLLDGDSNQNAWALAANWTARCEARKNIGDDDALFTVTGIWLANTLPNIVIPLAAVTTAALDFTAGIFSVRLTHTSGTKFTILNGVCTLRAEAIA